jgi:hypothetical protein
MFSTIWGICFSLEANPNGSKGKSSVTVLTRSFAALSQMPGAQLEAHRIRFDEVISVIDNSDLTHALA